MRWRNPVKELPKQDQIVWVLIEHSKENGALSCEIYCGEVEYNIGGTRCRAFNNDWIGAGSASWSLWSAVSEVSDTYQTERAKAWCPVEEISLPNF